MQIHDDLYEKEPDSRSHYARDIASAKIALEQMRNIVLGYSNSFILHANYNLLFFGMRADGDGSPAGRIFHGVGDQSC